MTDNTNTPNKEIKEIWGTILPTLIEKIQKAENDSYSINLLEEVKMANKDARKDKRERGINVELDVNVNENANSRILAKLFQYKSPDGKYEILQSLLDYISNRDENAVRNFGKIKIDNDKPIITTEETLNQETQNQDKDRIDILVRTGKYAIIFENKLFEAGDQDNQLARYIEKVKSVKEEPNDDSKYKYEDKNIFVIYLSRDGDEPAEKSWKNRETNLSYSKPFANRYANLSFKDDILRWLKDCVLPNVRKKDTDLESALVQYINYLERMFMKNNDVLTKWLEDKLKNKQQWEGSSETGRLEIVKELLATLNENEGENGKINVERLADLISFTKDNTNEDLLNKTIAVIENLRDNCRDKVLEPFYRVSKVYFDEDEIRPSHPSAAYCVMKKKEWKHEIRFIWNPFFFLDKTLKKDSHYQYLLMLDILHSSNEVEFNERISKLNEKGVFQKVNEYKNPKTMEPGNDSVEISYEILPIDLNSIENRKDNKMHPILRLTLKTDKKFLYFDPKHQETLFRAIYDSLSGVIEAINKCFENPA